MCLESFGIEEASIQQRAAEVISSYFTALKNLKTISSLTVFQIKKKSYEKSVLKIIHF